MGTHSLSAQWYTGTRPLWTNRGCTFIWTASGYLSCTSPLEHNAFQILQFAMAVICSFLYSATMRTTNEKCMNCTWLYCHLVLLSMCHHKVNLIVHGISMYCIFSRSCFKSHLFTITSYNTKNLLKHQHIVKAAILIHAQNKNECMKYYMEK